MAGINWVAKYPDWDSSELGSVVFETGPQAWYFWPKKGSRILGGFDTSAEAKRAAEDCKGIVPR